MPYALTPTADSVTRDVILNGILTSLPPGLNVDAGTEWHNLAEVFADSDFRVMQKLAEAQREMNPGTATVGGLLPEWEKIVLDNECVDVTGLTEAQRQQLVVSALKGGVRGLTLSAIQTDLNDTFPTINATVTEHFPFRVDDSDDNRRFRAGSRVGNYTWIQVGIPNYDPQSALHQRVFCRLMVTLPIGKVFWIYDNS